MRSEDVRKALARRFAAPEYAIFYEVGDATGARQHRWADAVAMSLWPSRGLELHGFEIKVSRSDWLSEMRNPAKAEPIARYMNRWWVVTPPGIVKADELPPTWGLYEVKGNGLARVTDAPVLSPVPIEPPFLAALLRRAHEKAAADTNAGIAKAMVDERAAIDATVKDRVDRELDRLRSANETAAVSLAKIKAACGVRADQEERDFLGYFDSEAFGRAVGIVHRLGIAKTYGGLRDIAGKLKPMAEAVEAMLPAETEGTEA